MNQSKQPLLSVKNLKKYFPIRKGLLSRIHGYVKAVDDVSFDLYQGETFGLVGESGCGKTTTGRTILRLLNPTEGTIEFDGHDISSISQNKLRPLRRNMQIIFQDPYSSLNPRMTVKSMLSEVLKFHKIVEKSEIEKEINRLLDIVGLQKTHANRYPHEFSGGQRQRIGIARALSVRPKLIICDEPVSALDVSIQAQIINLLKELQNEFGLTYLFIAHDLSVIEYISDRVGVMYLGKIVEIADSNTLYSNPQHPYTQALLSAVPIPDPEKKSQRIILTGNVPNPIDTPSGCTFHPRCPKAKTKDGFLQQCINQHPELLETAENHQTSCHLVNA